MIVMNSQQINKQISVNIIWWHDSDDSYNEGVLSNCLWYFIVTVLWGIFTSKKNIDNMKMQNQYSRIIWFSNHWFHDYRGSFKYIHVYSRICQKKRRMWKKRERTLMFYVNIESAFEIWNFDRWLNE